MPVSSAATGGLKPMLFVHIPKTAGTSFRHGVADFLGNNRMVLDYGPNQTATSPLIQRWRYGDLNPDKLRSAFDAQAKKFLSGHIRLLDYVGGFDLDNVAVFLRDPIQRVVSEYQHYVRHYGYQRTLEEFAQTETFQNRQARALAGVPIRRLGLVGLTERYEESLARLNEHFGWQVKSRSVNMGRSALSDSHAVDERTRRMLERTNSDDLKLYQSACKHFDDPGSPGFHTLPGAAIGACRLRDAGTIQGWACQIGSENATTVRIEVNGEVVAHTTADLFRSDIRQRGLKRSGCAGFRAEIEKSSPTDEIRCFETDGNTELNNSPLRWTEDD